ncbi:Cell division coordinator CpoB [Gammaproteobacteria bacterium]
MFHKKAALVVALVLQPIWTQGAGFFSSASGPVASEEGSEGLKQTVIELYRQLQTLQQEVQQLRGEVENQSRALETMKARVQNETAQTGTELQRPPGAAVESLPPVLVTTQTAPPRSAAVPVIPPLPGVPQSTAPVTSEQGAYDNAFGLLRAGSFDEASTAFQNFLANYGKSPLAANAQYWIGEALYVTRRFREAYPEFQKVVSDYPSAPKVADALLKCGYILAELNQVSEARKLLEDVISSFPQTTAAQLAAARLAKMKK